MHSCFCVLKGLPEMRKRRFHVISLINKRRYWTRGVHGDAINKYYRSKNIGDMGCISDEWDDTEFNIFDLKEYSYNIMMMSTFSGLTVMDGKT